MKAVTFLAFFTFFTISFCQNPTNPTKSFLDGDRKTYTTIDLNKSKGLKYSIEYPSEWFLNSGRRPNIERKITSPYKNISCSISVVKIEGGELSEKEKDIVYTRKWLEKECETNNFQFIDLNQRLDGERASLVAFRKEVKQLSYTIFLDMLVYTVAYDDKIIQLVFVVMNSPSSKVKVSFDKYETLFKQMANSFVLLSKWE